MPRRTDNPTTGEPDLTYREQQFVDEFIRNGGNGSKAAAAARYRAARADQSAYQVLHRPEVRRRIRERIAESRVSADEILGTLASFMRGRIGDFFDDSGNFSIEIAKERGVDHLLKTITTTTREIQATKTAPAQTVRTYRGQLHSPIQAAVALARIFGIYGRGANRASQPLATDHRTPATDFNVSTWLEDLIQQQIREQGLSRDAVVEHLLQVRREMAKYLGELPDLNKSADGLSVTDTAKHLGLILDLVAALATDPRAPLKNDPLIESALQTESLNESLNAGAITAQAFDDALRRINSRLSPSSAGKSIFFFSWPSSTST
jgi:hypothetical protein